MEIIKDIYKLVGIVRHIDLLRLEEAAKQYLNQFNISFEIINARSSALKVKTRQWKCKSGHPVEIPKLISITQDLFERFIENIPVTVHPIAYTPAVVDEVEPLWISDKMLNMGITLKDILRDTGVDRLSLTSWIEGLQPMSQDVKAMFFYYFESIQLRKNSHPSLSTFNEPCYN
ncbi:hypothetical protein AY601_1502 [Pedobacter cryoconitis]|uniref:Uncharacterized protein n=1 Tax=Pedobacter cryoconitis TaxID=188932 RepID=A0A127VB19_9SPHI|nr:hypothetical protein [Pedobacter cryoconitis]AMP98419.1 hypothetical protein AY601_1502 [Pedobacter cryoconitis]